MARHSEVEQRLKNKETPRVKPRRKKKLGAFSGGLKGFNIGGV